MCITHMPAPLLRIKSTICGSPAWKKLHAGSALPLYEEELVEVRGRDQIDGLPKVRQLSSHEITEAISDALSQIVTTVKSVLEQTPPELAADVADKGIIMSGGGSLLRNLDKLIARETGIPTYVADDPLSCVAIGAGRALENFEVFRDSLLTP